MENRYVVTAPGKMENHINFWEVVDTDPVREGDAVLSARWDVPGARKFVEQACLSLNATGLLR